ncbi:MAG: ATP-binding cassette domain-containing protein [Chloroflexales bacterium]
MRPCLHIHMPILNVQDLSKTFTIHAINREVPAFTNVSFHLQPGELLVARGANGVGKSSLLRCLYRTYLPSAGHALYQAQRGTVDLARAAEVDIALLRHSEIGYVSQFLRPRPRVSAIELVMEPLLLAGVPADDARMRAGDWLSRLGLKAAIWPAYPSTFSGGEQQKINLARALIAPRRLLLLDEPNAALDPGARAALRERLSVLKSEGVAMIGVFHHIEDVRDLVDSELKIANSQ